MVHIKRLDVRGFKSLGPRTFSLVFERGFTAITGPNGSGKSNIIDAILFCLGENSPKSLRVDRLGSLVFDGGPERERPSGLRVSLHLDNSDRRIPIDSKEIVVTRELNVEGESHYYLNGRRTQKSEIAHLLDLALVSAQGLNIVPQGLVMRVSELVPDEKRRLIEHVVGIGQFDEKRTAAMRQLQEADLKLQVAVARIGEIRNRVESLEAERNDQLRLQHLENQVRWLKGTIISRNLESMRRQIEEDSGSLKGLSEQLIKFKSELLEATQSINKVERDRRAFLNSVVEGAGGRRVEVEVRIAGKSAQVDRVTADVQESQSVVAKVSNDISYLTEMRQKQLDEVQRLRQRILESRSRLLRLAEEKDATEKELRRVSAEVSRKRAALEHLRSKEARLRQRAEPHASKIQQLITEDQILKNRLAQDAERLKLVDDKLALFTNTLKQLESRFSEIDQTIGIEEQAVGSVDESIKTAAEKIGRIEEEITTALETLEKASGVVAKYEAQRIVAERLAQEEMALRKLEQLSEAGAVDGYVGRLDRLIKYDDSYERAVLAVGRRWLKSALVKDLSSMLKLAEAIRRLKLGRVMLIPLSELEKSGRPRAPRLQGVLGSLPEFISGPSELKGVVNFIFGDTVLVNSAKTAYLVASQGLRAVTLAGDVFEAKSAAFETGYVTTFDFVVELVLEAKSISAVREALNSLRGLITKRKRDLKNLEGQSEDLGKDKMKGTILLERLRTEQRMLKRFIAKYDRLRRAIEARLAVAQKSFHRTQAKTKRVESILQGANETMEDIKKKLEELSPTRFETSIRELELKRATLLEQVEKLSSVIREETTNLTKEISELKLDARPSLLRIVSELAALRKEMSRRRKMIKEGNATLVELNHHLAKSRLEEAELLDSSRKSKGILDDFETRLADSKARESRHTHSFAASERQILALEKQIENQSERERGLLGQLSALGFLQPLEHFEMADVVLKELSSEFEELKNNVNLLAERTYKEIFEGYKNLSLRRNDLETERDSIVSFIEGVESEKNRVFLGAFEKIDRELRTIFTELTGGAAWLELENPDDIFSGGIFLMTQFPGKAARESSSVSGGEKTVTALSFILAMQGVFPSPFYLFDEIDAHLDVLNAERLADLLKERAQVSQIVVVTLKDSMVSRANFVYGVYMTDGVSQVVRYQPGLEVTIKGGR